MLTVKSDDPTDRDNNFVELLTRDEVRAYVVAELEEWKPGGWML